MRGVEHERIMIVELATSKIKLEESFAVGWYRPISWGHVAADELRYLCLRLSHVND